MSENEKEIISQEENKTDYKDFKSTDDNLETDKTTYITQMEFEAYKKELQKIKNDEFAKLNKNINRDKINVVTLSGLFVAIFTFISIEVQLFKYLNNIHQIIYLTMIFAGILILFIFLIIYLTKESLLHENTKITARERIIFIASLSLILGGIAYSIICKDENINNQDLSRPQKLEIRLPETIKVSQ